MKKTFTIIILLLLLSIGEANNSFIGFDDETARERIETHSQFLKEKQIREMVETIELKAEVKIPNHVNIEYIEYMYELASEFDIPIRTAFRLIYKESNFRDTVVSPVGAYGFMQLMPKTFEMYKEILNFNDIEISDNRENIYIGLYLLKDLYEYWSVRVKNDDYAWALALASYNAGKGRVIHYKGIPPFNETINYVNFIMREHSNPEIYANYLANYENTDKNGS